jgi:hypothetical protein
MLRPFLEGLVSRVGVFLFVVSVAPFLRADTVLDFEGLAEFTSVTTQYPGVVFSNATVLTAGSGLNEIDFPPNSGTNVVFDDGGPISLAFLAPVIGFGGYFNYAEPLTLQAFDASDNLLATITSAFTNNLGTLGDPGSHTNEFLQIDSFSNIAKVAITGDLLGSSFTLDDATIVAPSTVPEPASGAFVLIGLVLVVAFGRRRSLPTRQ